MIPDYFYLNESEEILLYRRIKDGGDQFVENYLKKVSDRETDTNFTTRKALSPPASFAKTEVTAVKNSIYQRLTDIVRVGGSDSYRQVVAGNEGGVDLDDSSMSHFIGQDVLSELLFMGVVGIFVDMPKIKPGASVAEAANDHPYCYIYTREQILNYSEDRINNRKVLTALKLQEFIPKLDKYGLPTSEEKRYRIYTKLASGIKVTFLDKDEVLVKEEFLDIPEIPFTILKLQNSLLHETGKYQVALMNLESTDIDYSLKANFAFYVEQSKGNKAIHLKEEAEIEVGNVQGREYTGDKAPEFINPDPGPMRVSMEKQEQMKNAISKLINLAVASVTAKSAESKRFDERGLEAGLSAIGEILEHGERKIAKFYSSYEGTTKRATINYPDKYSLKTDIERIEEVKLIQEQKDEIPSLTGKKALCKMAAHTLFDTKLSVDDVDLIIKEIGESNNTGASAKIIVADVEAGILGHETAAIMRGYDKDEPAKASQEHADRLARIEEAQTRARENTMAAARGIDDKAPDSQDAKEEKTESQDPNQNGDGKKLVRGEEK